MPTTIPDTIHQGFLVRPATGQDLSGLLALAKVAGKGFTSLPENKAFLKARLKTVEASFANALPTEKRDYLFVMEELASSRVVGVSSLIVHVQAMCHYEIISRVLEASYAHKLVAHSVLQCADSFADTSELATLFLHPDYRVARRGEFLSRCRLLFMAMHQQECADCVIAEMRGYYDEQGLSPLWEALGKRFFKSTPDEVADLVRQYGSRYIKDLLPKEAVYIDLLPKAARDSIGAVLEATKPALSILQKEGFRQTNFVDIVDGGPVIACSSKDVKTTRLSRLVTVEAVTPELSLLARQWVMLCVENKMILTLCELLDNQIILPASVNVPLSIKAGDKVMIAPFDFPDNAAVASITSVKQEGSV